jgi:regulator of sirC expression with transglutaminase-like and TPR domain
MHRSRPIILVILFLVSAGPAGGAEFKRDLLARLAALENEHRALCPSAEARPDLEAAIAALLRTSWPSPNPAAGHPQGIEALNRLVFAGLGVRSSRDLEDPCNLLPTAILERRQGYCVGLAALYLVLAERLKLPIFAVATPSHVFLRYDDGATRINIETQEGGANVPDERYIQEMKIPARSIRNGAFLRNLTADESLAQVHNNLGVIYSKRLDYESAAGEYERALSLDPRLPAAYYNYGKALLSQGQYNRAERLLSRALRLYPTDVWALNNRGMALCGLGKTRRAREDFTRALALDPSFTLAARNLSDGPCASTLGGD